MARPRRAPARGDPPADARRPRRLRGAARQRARPRRVGAHVATPDLQVRGTDGPGSSTTAPTTRGRPACGRRPTREPHVGELAAGVPVLRYDWRCTSASARRNWCSRGRPGDGRRERRALDTAGLLRPPRRRAGKRKCPRPLFPLSCSTAADRDHDKRTEVARTRTRAGATSRGRPGGGAAGLLDVDADHGLAEAARDLGDHVGVVVERRRLDDRLGARRPGCPT